MILCSNPKAQYLAHRDIIDSAIARVLDSGYYILGQEVENFETAFAAYTGASHAVGVGNGTDAITLALRGLGIGNGDEVITVSHTAVATAAAIELAGAEPVFIDIDPETYTLDATLLQAAVTPRTKAVVPVHLYGQPAHMDAILSVAREHDLKVVEDCAQAAGATYKGQRVGAIGDVGCFSFFPTKNLGALGDGGMITTSDAAVAERIQSLRQYGWAKGRSSTEPGVNSRLDELQAAILNSKLPFLDADNTRRHAIAVAYDNALDGMEVNGGIVRPIRNPDASHVFHLYVVRTPRRDALMDHLLENGIRAAIHYAEPVHRQGTYQSRGGSQSLEQTNKAAAEILTLPIYPELEQQTLDKIIGALVSFAELS